MSFNNNNSGYGWGPSGHGWRPDYGWGAAGRGWRPDYGWGGAGRGWRPDYGWGPVWRSAGTQSDWRSDSQTTEDKSFATIRANNEDNDAEVLISAFTPGGVFQLGAQPVASGAMEDIHLYKGVYDIHVFTGDKSTIISKAKLNEPIEISVANVLKGETSDIPTDPAARSIDADAKAEDYFSSEAIEDIINRIPEISRSDTLSDVLTKMAASGR